MKEVNSRQYNSMPKKYALYKLLYDVSVNLYKDEKIVFYSSYNTRVEDIIKQKGPKGYIYITNNKILLMDKQNQHILLEKVVSVTFNKKGIIIANSANSVKILGIPRVDVQRIIKEINTGMENHKNISININKTTHKDVADKIARLKVLYDEGVLTEYEFNMKKMELLDKEK